MPKPKRETYKVTMPDDMILTFTNDTYDEVPLETPLQFVQKVAQMMNSVGVATGCKAQRVKA